MVGRFESAEFKAEVAKQEERFAKEAEDLRWPRWVGFCLAALLLVVWAMRSPSFAWGHLSTGEPEPPPSPLQASASGLASAPHDEEAPAAPAPEEPDGGLYMATFGRTAGVSADVGPSPRPASAGSFPSGALPRQAFSASDYMGMRPDFTLLGLVVAVVVLCLWPNMSGGPMVGCTPYGAGAPWGASPGGAGAPWAASPGGAMGAGLGGAAQSPWGSPSPGYGGGVAGMRPSGWAGNPGPAAYGWQGAAAGFSLTPGLPSEQDVAETNAAFGSRLQRWAAAVMQYVHREVLTPLLAELESSDRLWHAALAKQGWQLVFEERRLPQLGFGGAAAQQLSVFDKQLPPQLCEDAQAAGLWQQRQRLERCLVPRGFEAARQYVLDRLRQWQQRGPQSPMQHDWRPSPAQPSDGHILENLIVAVLSCHVEGFEQCFMAASPTGVPAMLHQGQPHVAFLRQVADQSFTPRPPPHYEVVTAARVWRLRPGGSNLPEALGILLQALKLQHRSYATFPLALRQALDAADAPFASVSGALDWLWRGWGGGRWGA